MVRGTRRATTTLAVVALVLAGPAAEAQQGVEDGPPARTIALHTVGLEPYTTLALVPDSVTAGAIGADLSVRVNRFVALALDGAWFTPFEASPSTPRYPLNETRASGDLDVQVFPWPARARRGGEGGTFEPYALAGLGVVVTRPVAVVDPVDRHFGDDDLVAVTLGVGARFFVTRWFALDAQVRDSFYFERQESPTVSATDPQNPTTWYDPATHLTHDLQLRLGLSFFLGAD